MPHAVTRAKAAPQLELERVVVPALVEEADFDERSRLEESRCEAWRIFAGHEFDEVEGLRRERALDLFVAVGGVETEDQGAGVRMFAECRQHRRNRVRQECFARFAGSDE